MRLLLIDDEVQFVRALRQTLTEQQFLVDICTEGLEGLEMARTGTYDLLVVDVMLPGMSGLQLVRTLRDEDNSVPVLLLTARDGVEDRVKGLDHGADDYLVKPFAVQELLARIRALTRRIGTLVGPQKLEVGDLSLDFVSRQVELNGQPLPLTAKEFQILELFMRNPGTVLPKDLILDRIWGYEAAMDTNVVEIYVHFLRKKLDGVVAQVENCRIPSIDTVRGVGYVFRGE